MVHTDKESDLNSICKLSAVNLLKELKKSKSLLSVGVWTCKGRLGFIWLTLVVGSDVSDSSLDRIR